MIKKQNYHITAIILFLVLAGIGLTAYEHYSLHVPFSAQEQETVWNIEAAIHFEPEPEAPTKVILRAPKTQSQFIVLNENMVAKDYGVTINEKSHNKKITWSIKDAKGPQTLYYRIDTYAVNADSNYPTLEKKPKVSFEEVSGAKKEALNALLHSIQKKSADSTSFSSQAIQLLNAPSNHNSSLLLGMSSNQQEVIKTAITLHGMANIPAKFAYILTLHNSKKSNLELWLASYNGNRWQFFDPTTGAEGLPENTFIWAITDNEPILEVSGGQKATINFGINQENLSQLQLAEHYAHYEKSKFIDYSLLSLPIHTQSTYKVLIMIPVGVLVILLLRSFVGIRTLGTFMPVLIALAFRETQVFLGLLLFVFIITIGLGIRYYLDQLRLLLVARLAIILTCVVMLMGCISILSHKLNYEHGLSITLFPMVILTMSIERVSILWEERGATEAIITIIGSLLSAVLAYYAMVNPTLSYLFFIFPGLTLITIAIMLLLGIYRGYRLSEFIRFRALIKESN